jgi:hypothetical protein
MPGPSKRSMRRHHAARRKRWVKQNLAHYFLNPNDPEPRRVGLYAESPKTCSCWMCGNPRRYFLDPPLTERRAPDVDDFDEG